MSTAPALCANAAEGFAHALAAVVTAAPYLDAADPMTGTTSARRRPHRHGPSTACAGAMVDRRRRQSLSRHGMAAGSPTLARARKSTG